MRRVETTGDVILGENTEAVEIWRILPTKILFLPGATAKSTTVLPRVRQSERFQMGPVLLVLRTWQGMFGNGALIITKRIAAHRRSIRAGQLVAQSAFIAVAAGSLGSTAKEPPRGVRPLGFLAEPTWDSGPRRNGIRRGLGVPASPAPAP